MNARTLPIAIAIAALTCASFTPVVAQGNDDEFARRQYDSGLAFMQRQRYAEALKDFQAVADGFPRSPVADDALLQIALYQLEGAHDQIAARSAIETLLKTYPDSDSAPFAYVVDGRLKIARSRAAADVDAAMASFERVPRLYPDSEAVAAAWYYMGDALQLTRRPAEGLPHFRRVMLEFPRSIWSARAVLALTRSLVQIDTPATTLADLQRIRQAFPDTPEAATALAYNSILYRFQVRPKGQPYRFTGSAIGEASRLRDVIGVAVDGRGQLMVGHRQGVTGFDADGKVVTTVSSEDPSAFFLAEANQLVTVRRNALLSEGTAPVLVMTPASPGRTPRPIDEIQAAAVLSSGERILADRDSKTVLRVARTGEVTGTFATMNTRRLAVNGFDDVAMIDAGTKAVVLADRSGKTLLTLPARGTGYQWQDPNDVAFDALGNLYVLDSGKAAIYVFAPGGRLIGTVTPPTTLIQKPRGLALDAAGRLFVFDERTQRVEVLQ